VILDRFDHKINFRAIEYLIKYCHHCQNHEKSSSRFSFTLKDDLEFNFNVIVDIFYLEIKTDVNKSILHVMNETTRFLLVEMMWVGVGFWFEDSHQAGLSFSGSGGFGVGFTVGF
jgi:hypothetical protein